ncbi:MAG: protein kinase [Proteobacteria bacterium]|nr:protein kinase [Pseudomonadota bacterium]
MQRERWQRLELLFAQALALPEAERTAWLARTCGSDGGLLREVGELLHAHTGEGVLDTPPLAAEAANADTAAIAPSLAAGTLLGVWRIERLVGRGGMGEIYAALRHDAGFSQRGALKLLRFDAIGELQRFHAERQILARLDHPGIARLLDGGVAPDGRPYTVMEFVEGVSLLDWCNARKATFDERLDLFVQVCDAVAYAHRNLVIHRDLKPANTLVDAEGRVKLLDFGIAKLVDTAAANNADATATVAPFTLDYAAPEQLAGEPVTTATDVYALGVLLFELLAGERPLRKSGLPSAQALALLEREAPLASRVVRDKAGAPVPASVLSGDIDAIVAKCLRRESAHRYDTVNGLKLDLLRHRAREPVLAREGARTYVFGRVLRRYRWAVAAAAVLVLALAAGIAATTWQARRAAEQAVRAEAAKNFLLGIFKASDPRIASDKPRGQITARELLEASADRIEKEFATQPDLQIEMLDEVAVILRELGEKDRYAQLHARQMELARARYGADSPIVIGGLLQDAGNAVHGLDYAAAAKPLDEADAAIRRAGLDQTALRARWWLVRGQALVNRADASKEREEALLKSVEMYARFAPDDPAYATALNDYGNVFLARGDNTQAIAFYRRALQTNERLPNRDDAETQMMYGNLAQAHMQNGDFADAQQVLAKVADIARRTYGEKNAKYWFAASFEAQSACLGGDRERALRLFAQLAKLLAPTDEFDHDVALVREKTGYCLVGDGQLLQAIPLLESALAAYRHQTQYPIEIPRVERTLGDAYARTGRIEDARRTLNEALALLGRGEPGYSLLLSVRVQLGRFLLDQGDLDGAKTQFQETIAQARERRLAPVALAHAGMARLALARKDAVAATEASAKAVEMFEHVEGFRDMRVQPYLWQIRAEAALASGDAGGAREWAQKAVAAYQRCVSPESADLREARATLAKAGQGAPP